VWFEVRDQTGATDFLGYKTEHAAGELKAFVKDGKLTKKLKLGDQAFMVLNQTPFYAESGGQVGDRGTIKGKNNSEFEVTGTLKILGNVFAHQGVVKNGTFELGQAVDLSVDRHSRAATRANHSATHLLHEALRQVLGTHVAQKGSLVAPERLRFDFSHPKPLSTEQIAAVENLANAIVDENAPVETHLMAIEDALESGAMALFGEKYGDEVRVVSMGATPSSDDTSSDGKAWSVELCGGTHARRTGDIGLIKIITETASASGVRRIEALTSAGARDYLARQDARVNDTAALLRARPEDVPTRVASLLEERKQLERELSQAKREAALGGGGNRDGKGASDDVRTIGNTKLLARAIKGLNPKDLRALIDDGKQQIGSGVVAIIGITDDGKAGLAVGVTKDLASSLSAVDLVRVGAAAMGGKGGGGRPDMAQAGGPDGAKAGDALKAIEKTLESHSS